MFHELRKAYERKSPGSLVPAGNDSYMKSSDMLDRVKLRVLRIKVNAATRGFNTEPPAEKAPRNDRRTLPIAAGHSINAATQDFHLFPRQDLVD
jgi:hypothetical protein